MTLVSWATLYEGATDAAYFDVLIPRMMEDVIVARRLGRATIPLAPAFTFRRTTVQKVAKEACAAREAFQLLFIHADSGGRNLAAGIAARSEAYCEAMVKHCNWPPVRCIIVSPRHEMEAWALADPEAVTAALGWRGRPESIGLPATGTAAERLPDPKSVLDAAISQVRGRRRRVDAGQLFSAIAQRQSVARLRQAPSFAQFEHRLAAALADLSI